MLALETAMGGFSGLPGGGFSAPGRAGNRPPGGPPGRPQNGPFFDPPEGPKMTPFLTPFWTPGEAHFDPPGHPILDPPETLREVVIFWPLDLRQRRHYPVGPKPHLTRYTYRHVQDQVRYTGIQSGPSRSSRSVGRLTCAKCVKHLCARAGRVRSLNDSEDGV